MKIDASFYSTHPATQESAVAKAAGSPVESTSPGAGSSTALDGDQAHLSQSAVLAARAASLPEVRTEKVAAVQQALANGSYAVSPSDLAGKLIDHLLQN